MTSIAPQPLVTPLAGAADLTLLTPQPGQTLTAMVLAILDATTIRLATSAGTIDIKSGVPLTPGTRVEVSVEGTAAEPKFVVTPRSADPAPLAKQIISGATSGQTAIAAPKLASSPTPAPALAPALDDPAALKAFVESAAVIVRDAAARQGGLTPLYADIESVLAQAPASIPAPVADAMRQLLTLRLDATAGSAIDVADIKSALAQSGLASSLANNQDLASRLTQSPASAELQSALRTLQQALKTWVQAAPADEKPMAQSTPLSTAGPASQQAAVPRAANLMPPYRNAPMVPQAPSVPLITGKEPSHTMAVHLLDETESAIARQNLLQIASLPDEQTSAARQSDSHAARMTFDIPLATDQGTAVAQLRIERDGKNGSGDVEDKPVWRANFSIDLESIGPVHVRISQAGERTMVILNAERPETAQRLSAELPLLEVSLRKAQLDPGDLYCHARAPDLATAAPGLFTDQAT